MFIPAVEIDQRIVRGDRGSRAERRLHQARCSCARSARPASRAARARSRSARAKTADASAWRSLHHSGIDSAEESARLCTQNVRVRDRKIVAGNCQVEIVFQRKIDRVLQRKIKLPVANQLVKMRRISQRGLGNCIRLVCVKRVIRFRHLKLNWSCILRCTDLGRPAFPASCGLRLQTGCEHSLRTHSSNPKSKNSLCE